MDTASEAQQSHRPEQLQPFQESGQEFAREGNTYVIDPENAAEMARLMQQDRLATESMGGLLPEVEPPPDGGRVLDLACGPGGWALELAFACPKVEVIGIDINTVMIDYANAQAWSQGLNNAHFQVMNVMEPLAFPDRSFDLINGRFMFGFMLPHAWPSLLAECRRLLKPGGILRLTEAELPLTTSASFERFIRLNAQALKRAGQSFSPDGHHIGILPVLPRLVRQAGFEQVRLRASVTEWSSGTPAHYDVFTDHAVLLELVQPFLIRTGVATQEELKQLYQQTIAEMQLEDFAAIGFSMTLWGYNPHEP
jgi:ubiquinone/menaquinone biosynthesis C-methylase UbiE